MVYHISLTCGYRDGNLDFLDNPPAGATSFTHTLPAISAYIAADAWFTASVCDVYYNCTTIESSHFATAMPRPIIRLADSLGNEIASSGSAVITLPDVWVGATTSVRILIENTGGAALVLNNGAPFTFSDPA